MPGGIARLQQMTLSNLMDAYKRTEFHPETGLGLYYLNAIPVDRAEPSESLTTNVAWHSGLSSPEVLINPEAIDLFIKGSSATRETDMRTGRGAYLLESHLRLKPEREENWMIVIDQGYDAGKLSKLENQLKNKASLIPKLKRRYEEIGADGKLYFNNGSPLLVNLAEKLLVSTLTKLYNFIPDAGIWLNTQRPEWNDANNALVGYGCSMVTVYYLHRQLAFYKELFQGVGQVELTNDLAALFATMKTIFKHHEATLERGFNDESRWQFVEALGRAGEKYRAAVYGGLPAKSSSISEKDILDFLSSALRYIEKSIENNKRPDGMYHAYNLIDFHDASIEINHLYEMLEGQVAVLSAGFLSPSESLEVLNALRDSAMCREDQESYMLYPDKYLPEFMEKNLPEKEKVESIPTLRKMVKESDRKVVYKDAAGNYRFASNLRNSNDLKNMLTSLGIGKQVARDILALYEDTFRHRFFTGRSGTFFGYEGLGSIYWHMVSKLLLAIGENIAAAKKGNAPANIQQALQDRYYEVKKGIGAGKSPETYGAFPMEAYSHTPWGSGVKQPGMTGQVKEDILSRMYELGLSIDNGNIIISPELLRDEEFLTEDRSFSWIDVSGHRQQMAVPKGCLVFTFAQVPFLLKKTSHNSVEWIMSDGASDTVQDTLRLPGRISDQLFRRSGAIERINICFV